MLWIQRVSAKNVMSLGASSALQIKKSVENVMIKFKLLLLMENVSAMMGKS